MKVKCLIEHLQLKFYGVFNCIFSRSKGANSELTTVELLKSYCLPFLLYGFDAVTITTQPSVTSTRLPHVIATRTNGAYVARRVIPRQERQLRHSLNPYWHSWLFQDITLCQPPQINYQDAWLTPATATPEPSTDSEPCSNLLQGGHPSMNTITLDSLVRFRQTRPQTI